MVFMDSLPTIKEKLAFKNKLITDGKNTSDMYIWTQSGKFVCKFGSPDKPGGIKHIAL